MLTTITLAMILASSASAQVSTPAPSPPTAAAPRAIELTICLDTSGSMNGLIDSARSKIWDIVSDLATATPQPQLRVALLTYGNDGLAAENGWTNVETDFTENLDLVSQKLFALTTNGGTEYVGRVIDRATKSLAWTAGDGALKILVVAGNESADQDQQVLYGDACKRAIERMIVVNSIYCGSPTDPLAAAWQDVAKRADGHFASIDQNNGTVVIATPFDDDLVTLSAKLNETYLAYGETGAWNASNQSAQDLNAASLNNAVAAQRCVTKGGGLYSNQRWDLVDACKETQFKLEDVKDAELPEALRGKTLEEKRAYIDAKAKERAAIQAQVNELGMKRTQFIAAETAKQAGSDKSAFDQAIRDAIRAQATARGFVFPAASTATTVPAVTEASAAKPNAG